MVESVVVAVSCRRDLVFTNLLQAARLVLAGLLMIGSLLGIDSYIVYPKAIAHKGR